MRTKDQYNFNEDNKVVSVSFGEGARYRALNPYTFDQKNKVYVSAAGSYTYKQLKNKEYKKTIFYL